MKVPTLLFAAMGVAIGILVSIGGKREGQIGVLNVAIADDVRVARAERARGDSLDRVFRVDTVRVFRSLLAIDTLIQHRIDTAIVQRRDTVVLTVREAAAVQDTVRACRALVLTCAEGWAAARRENAALTAETTRLRAMVPTKAGIWARCAAGAGLGAAGGGGIAGGRDGAVMAAVGAVAGCFLVGR